MNEGVIIGGWNYVIAAYSITAVGLLGYAWSLIARRRKFTQRED
jgi:CcmD family protein